MLGSSLLLRFWDWHAVFWSLGIAGMVIFALGCTVASSREADAPSDDWLVHRIVSGRRFSRPHRVVARRKRPTKPGVFGAGVVRTEPPAESSPENTSADPGWAIPSA
jgi:hypothetical protein